MPARENKNAAVVHTCLSSFQKIIVLTGLMFLWILGISRGNLT